MRIRGGCPGNEMSGLIDDADPSALRDALLQEDIVQAESADNGGQGIAPLAPTDHRNADDINPPPPAGWRDPKIAFSPVPRPLHPLGTWDTPDKPPRGAA